MPTGDAWRLIVEAPSAGAWNMAVDEAILDSYAGPAPPAAPTLRLYGWDPPTLSLGSSPRDDEPPAVDGVDRVRRPTGGAAVLHHLERTYSVCARLREPPFPGGVVETYREISEALVEAMRGLGVDDASGAGAGAARGGIVCFETASTHEIQAGGRKLIGSAQLRRRSAFLQHGSIPLGVDLDLSARVFGRAPREELFTDLGRALGREVGSEELDRALIDAFEARFDMRFRRGGLDEGERERAEVYAAGKYSGPGSAT